MRLPPIIERELRTASRRGITYWMRCAAASAVVAIAAPMLMVFELAPRLGVGGLPTSDLGPALLAVFSFVAFVTCLAAGWFFASDAIAHERREGTLELLFLAPLRPRDVVFAKLVAVSWRGSQWLLAAIPLFALPLLMGGVDGDALVALACLAANTLFWSVATSLWASSRAQTMFQALTGTLALQFVLFVVPFLVDLALVGWDLSRVQTRVGLLSPAYGWTHPPTARFDAFWSNVALVHVEAWLLLALTIRSTARQIRQNPSGRSPGIFHRLNTHWNYGTPGARAGLRTRLLAIHPIRWLVERERGPGRFLLGVVMILVLAIVLGTSITQNPGLLLGLSSVAWLLLSVTIAILFALQATRFMVEARRTGALELLLVSPLSSREILAGQFRSLARIFALPILMILVGQLALSVYQMNAFGGTPSPATAGGPGAPLAGLQMHPWVAQLMGFAIGLAGYASLAWVGLWMGLACRQVSIAVFATLAIAKVLPFLALAFAQASLVSLVLGGRVPGWSVPVANGVLSLGLHLTLIAVARYQLLPDLRRILDAPSSFILPQPRPAAPPVLPS